MAAIRPGCEISRERSARRINRHHHLAPYAALVLRGGYVEAGDRGRFRAAAGDVLLHDAFETHQDEFGAGGADILNLRLAEAPRASVGRIDDPDRIAITAERDPQEAALLLLDQLLPAAAAQAEWPDRLAADLRANRVASLAGWADAAGIAPSSLSRGFRLAYGVSPQRFRADCRAGEAARALQRTELAIAMIAADCGFADQPHLTRSISRLTGCSPARLRVKSFQDRIDAAA
jgi:AraC-like DNA-binding protein